MKLTIYGLKVFVHNKTGRIDTFEGDHDKGKFARNTMAKVFF